jgi:radical SAM superfamily enzyme YgiQ (UPF0313 family)
MLCHPGEDMRSVSELKRFMNNNDVEEFQMFTPTPMSDSTAMYYSGLDMDFNPLDVVYDYNTKKKMKRVLLGE